MVLDVGAARPLAINREAGNCAHLQPLADPPQARLHCAPQLKHNLQNSALFPRALDCGIIVH